MDFHIGSIICTDGQSTIEHEFHVTSTRGFFRSQGNLLRNICCWNDETCFGHIVVFNHNYLQMRRNFRIVFDDLRQDQNQVDNILGNGVGWCCFSTKENSQWAGRNVTSLDVQILVDDIEDIHLLTLVLMQTLDLYIKNRIWIDLHTLVFQDMSLQFSFVVLFDFF